MFVNSFVTESRYSRIVKTVNREVKFWARRGDGRAYSAEIFFDVMINGKFYFFSYDKKFENFYYNGGYGIQNIGSRVPRVYYTVDGMQFCVTAKGRLWVKQL